MFTGQFTIEMRPVALSANYLARDIPPLCPLRALESLGKAIDAVDAVRVCWKGPR